MKKQSYRKPETWAEELNMESSLLVHSVTNIQGISGTTVILNYGGGGNGPARAEGSSLWDDEEGDDSYWDNI